MKKYRIWLSNAPVAKKFRPVQIITCALLIIVSIVSLFAVVAVNNMAQQIFTYNVENKENLSDIIRKMYVCRVLGRDILLQESEEATLLLYEDYLVAFDTLDQKMDEYASALEGEKLETFNAIIAEKNKYKDSMIESADIKIEGGAYEEALEALTSVTPIANEFFGSIDAFLAEEERQMNEALALNNSLVTTVFIVSCVTGIISVILLILLLRVFSKAMSRSLIELEKSVSVIAETGNMRTDIPASLFTKDEVGRIAIVVDKLKNMLLEYSYTDTLTGGLNAKAYHEELHDIFNDETDKNFWCVISDMNNLKVINDKLGHIEGDTAIRTCYAVIDDNFKDFGKTFRVGGDEFVSIISGCTKEDIDHRLNLTNAHIEKLNTHPDYRFSVAHGASEFHGSVRSEYDAFFKLVDKRMYLDKEAQKKHARLNARVPNHLLDQGPEEND